jgi:hypothetical protein
VGSLGDRIKEELAYIHGFSCYYVETVGRRNVKKKNTGRKNVEEKNIEYFN